MMAFAASRKRPPGQVLVSSRSRPPRASEGSRRPAAQASTIRQQPDSPNHTPSGSSQMLTSILAHVDFTGDGSLFRVGRTGFTSRKKAAALPRAVASLPTAGRGSGDGDPPSTCGDKVLRRRRQRSRIIRRFCPTIQTNQTGRPTQNRIILRHTYIALRRDVSGNSAFRRRSPRTSRLSPPRNGQFYHATQCRIACRSWRSRRDSVGDLRFRPSARSRIWASPSSRSRDISPSILPRFELC